MNRLRYKLRTLFQKQKVDAEMAEEMELHIENQTQSNITAGMSPEEARRAARRQFGWVESIKDTCREQRGVSWIENLGQDIRYGARMLRKNPSFTAIAVLTLALGIGANTAIFSVVNGVLLKPLPYDEPGQLVNLWEAPPGGQSTVSPGAFTDWRDGNTTGLEALSVVRGKDLNLSGDGEPERLNGLEVCASYLQILRLQPLLGRGFLPGEDKPGQDNKVAVITHGLWQRRFGADLNIIGRRIRLNSEPHTVVGVLSANAALIGHGGNDDRQFLVPFVFGTGQDFTTRNNHLFNVIARLKPNVTREQAQAELTALKQRLQPLYAGKENWTVKVAPLQESITGKVKPILLMLMGAVAFVLLIACANVVNLLLAKAASRQKEMAIRTALGASRWRVIRQVLTESSLLALFGALLGVGLAYWGTQVLTRWSGAILPRVAEVALDACVLSFSLLAAISTGLLFGLVPALRASTPDINKTLKEGGRGSAIGPRNRTRAGLIVAEVALALILLAGAGLLVRSFFRLLNVNPGFNPKNTLVMDISLPQAKYPGRSDTRSRFFQQLFETLEALPGVEAAGMASSVPMLGWSNSTDFKRPDQPEQSYDAPFNSVSGNYFGALRIPLLRGRVFSPRDNFTNTVNFTKPLLPVIFNEALAKKVFPNEDPLGKRVRFWGSDDVVVEWEIVGIVGNVRQKQLDDSGLERLYIPHIIFWQDGSLVVRTKGAPLALADSIRKEILAIDSEVPVSNIRAMEQVISNSLSDRRFSLMLLGSFAAAALGLAVVGLYGVVSYLVTQRTQEIGIRMALGAQRTDVLWLILRHGLGLTLLGVTVGLGGAFALTRVLRNYLYEIGPTDPVTFGTVAFLLVVVALFACLFPARRATKVHPMVALRYE